MRDSLLNLTGILSRIKKETREPLADLPDRIATVLELYNRPGLNEAKTADIYALINGSLHLAEALATDTYPGPVGIKWATYNIQILTRLINHLEDRPSVSRLGLLCVETGELHSEIYASTSEANEAVNALRRFGATRTFEVVPVTLTSGHVVQPPANGGQAEMAPVEPPPLPPSPEEETDEVRPAPADFDEPIIIPRGVKPA